MIIKCDAIKKTYKLKNKEINAIDDVSFKFKSGNFYAIMGHSGSGKSTLVHCLGLLDEVNSGEIYYGAKRVSDLTEEEKAQLRMKTIGFVFQSFYLSPKLKAYENVMLPMYINDKIDKKNRKDKAVKLLSQFGLSERIEHFPKELSGGEQQRVALARALANDPDVILADEPTGNLDVDNEKYVMETLKELAKKGKCVIVVSHNEIVEKYADKVLYMEKGKFGVKNEK